MGVEIVPETCVLKLYLKCVCVCVCLRVRVETAPEMCMSKYSKTIFKLKTQKTNIFHKNYHHSSTTKFHQQQTSTTTRHKTHRHTPKIHHHKRRRYRSLFDSSGAQFAGCSIRHRGCDGGRLQCRHCWHGLGCGKKHA